MGPVMTKLPLKFIHSFVDRHGVRRYYVRRRGFKRVPLPGQPLSEEFMAAYRTALAGQPKDDRAAKRVAPGSINAAIAGYIRSHGFLALKKSTQRVRRGILNNFRSGHGDKPVALLERRHLVDMLAEKAGTPFAADNWLTAVRKLLSWCVDDGMIRRNPASDIKSVRPRTDGYRPWEDEQVALYRQRHTLGTQARLALELLLNVGVRRGDVVRVGRQHIRAGVISIRTQKGDVQLDIPVLPELQAAMEAMPPSDHLTFLVTAYGKARTANGFGGWFADRCREAGLPKGYSAHGLRKCSATRLAENGATAHELMAWFGWTNIREAELYTRRADRKKLAGRAGARIIGGTGSGNP
jgi:integrase